MFAVLDGNVETARLLLREGGDEEIIQMIEALGVRPEPEALKREEPEPEDLDSTSSGSDGTP